MSRTRAPSPATCATLIALDQNHDGLHGYDIMRATGVRPGTLYPMLSRLEQQGLMAAEWEASLEPGRPPRHIYRLTIKGGAFVQKIRSVPIAARPKTMPQGVRS